MADGRWLLGGAYMTLTFIDVLISASLVLVAIIVSWWLKLGLARTLIVASIRTIVQLSLIGLILAWVFARESMVEVLTILSLMTIIAAISAKNRVKKPYQGLFIDTLIALGVATFAVTLVAMLLILQVSPWYAPQYIIPILGLILGNSLTAISLTTGRLIEHLHEQQSQIRTLLALSATPFEACHRAMATAISAGMLPTINSMMVVGLVSLPGMMTGQILAGANPTQAVRYQIVTMFLICAGSTISCTLSAVFVIRRFFDKQDRLVIPK
ncbi:iron export ABC transporter permease subunit FetB [Moraxella sp. FZLJ2107]|uniref:ABC transporter permease n=1 Tax=unclassified Moraxella TaxID=2685852 RepID=UPI0020C8BCF8|nr:MULTISPECIES: iron export ABC transporter permease subunit FetB [unclassified Moraxella]UTO05502.1 iron export ABC transporter permease subunit FetB [Moraxella sp. FZLJ2107]UTO22238.1 iron export ABC transporter permease subunit FetB [Moraxella sp. FZLJ2109]